jgi:steroid delta-isomerase-like uncharacterized protein
MSAEQNRAVVKAIFDEIVNRRETGNAAKLIGPTYVNHMMPLPTPGPDGLVQVLETFRAGFPDIQVAVEDAIAEGDRVATRGYFRGTHRGPFMGLPATGKPVQVAYADIWRFEDGKAVENWVQMDLMGLMQQIGAIAPPAAASV